MGNPTQFGGVPGIGGVPTNFDPAAAQAAAAQAAAQAAADKAMRKKHFEDTVRSIESWSDSEKLTYLCKYTARMQTNYWDE